MVNLEGRGDLALAVFLVRAPVQHSDMTDQQKPAGRISAPRRALTRAGFHGFWNAITGPGRR